MRIAAYLLLAFVVFSYSIDLSSSEPRKLKDFFPKYNGVMPPVERFWFEDQPRNFEIFDNKPTIKYLSMTLMKRDHIIFGCTVGFDGVIRDLYRLFKDVETTFIVFDLNENKWITLPRELTRKLGVGHQYAFVSARDEVAATHLLTSNSPIYREAHIKACREANDRVDNVEKEQEYLLYYDPTNIESSIRAIKEEYSQAYNRAFTLHLHHHGEYNIQGQREMHS